MGPKKMINKLAEELYGKSVKFKKYSVGDLLRRTKRSELLEELNETQTCVNQLLKEMKDDADYSSEYYELALFMSRSLFECVFYLASANRNSKLTALKYIHGFHNLPRAFLSLENRSHISANDALNYYRSYLMLD